MAKNYLISVLLSLVDNLTAPLIAMNRNVRSQLVALGTELSTIGRQMTTFLTLPIIAAGTASLVSAGNFEKQRVALETLLGSEEKAAILLRDIEEFSARTPFQLPGLIDVSKRLLAFGFAAEEVLDVTNRLGDAAMGDAAKLDQLTDAFGKVRAKGKASMRELNMFTYAGVPIVQALADELETTTEGVYELSAKGVITFEMVNNALNNLTTGTGKFSGMIDKMAYTLPGLFSTFLDNIGLMAKAFGEEMAPAFKDILRGLTDFMKWLKNLDSSTKQLIITVLGLVAAMGPLLFLVGKLIKFFVTGLTPLNLFIMAIGALVVGIIALNEMFKKSLEYHKNNAKAIGEEIDDTKALKEEYEELNKKATLTNEEKQRMANIEQILADRIGDTAFALDEQSNKLQLNLEEYQRYIERKTELMVKELEMQILQDEKLKQLQDNIIENTRRARNYAIETGEDPYGYIALYDNAVRESGRYELAIMNSKEQIAGLRDALQGVVETAEDTTDKIEKLYDFGATEETPLLSIPTKVKEQLQDLEDITSNISDNLQSNLQVSAPDDIVTSLIGRLGEINSSVDVKIRIETDENTTATITEYNKTGNANVTIDINDLLGSNLSEVLK